MIDHVSLMTSDFARSRAFYAAALAPLGYSVLMEFTREQVPSLQTPHTAGLGANAKPDLWLVQQDGSAVNPVHIAIAAANRAQVDAFYAAALAAGGKPNGEPGPRPQYHAGYYGAFVLDPDGHNIEAVCHQAP